MTDFLGQVTYKVDDKGRIPIPPSFRSALEAGMTLTKGEGGCITIYTKAKWEEIGQSLDQKGVADRDHRTSSRALFFNAHPATLDGQGRIMLPPQLREYAGITDSATVAGANTWAEVWNPERLKGLEAQGEQVWEVIDRLQRHKEQDQ